MNSSWFNGVCLVEDQNLDLLPTAAHSHHPARPWELLAYTWRNITIYPLGLWIKWYVCILRYLWTIWVLTPQDAFKKNAGLPECLASPAWFISVLRFRAWPATVLIVWRENRAFRNCPVSPDAGFAYFWKASRADSSKVSSPSNWQTSLTSRLPCWSLRALQLPSCISAHLITFTYCLSFLRSHFVPM